MACRATVQPLTEKHKISWRLLKIENQFFHPVPYPLPSRCAGAGELFLWFFAGGRSLPAKNLYFFSLSPTAHTPLRRGRGRGKGYRLQRFIHRRLATWRQAEQPPHIFIFGWCAPAHGVSFENRDQRVSSQRISEKAKRRISEKNHLRGKCNANFSLRSGRPGMNSGSDSTPTTRFNAVGSCQAGDSIPSRTGESSQPVLTTHASQGYCSATD